MLKIAKQFRGEILAALAIFGALAFSLSRWSPDAFTQVGSEAYLPHGYCYLWNQRLVSLHVLSDSVIFLCYISISISLAYLVYLLRREMPLRWIFAAFGLFIVACGFTHAMDVVVLWKPFYWLAGDIKLLTACASLVTAIWLPYLFPQISRLVKEAAAGRVVHDALVVTESRFLAFMDNSPAMVYIKDRDGRMLYMNRILLKTWNLDQREWLGKTDAELWTPELAMQFRQADQAVLETNTVVSSVDVVPLPNGALRNFLNHKFPVLVQGGERCVGGVTIDITEQKEAERQMREALAEKEVLIKEVHHRVKNNLQVICSLLGIQAAAMDDPEIVEALRESQDRVQSMALIHELLYSSESLADIDFSHYAERLLEVLLESSQVHLRMEVSPLRLGIDRAIPCGLILNELVSNALKHAFPGRRQGEIVVFLREDERGEVCLAVADDGVGLPPGFNLAATRSLGLRIVQILAGQLNGRFQVAPREAAAGAGTRFEVLIPA